MERILSENEKIKKAEEIYLRRNCENYRTAERKSENKIKVKNYIVSKILLEFIILLLTACIIFAIKNKNFIFSTAFLDKISCYNINITEKFKKIVENNEKEDNIEANIEKNEELVNEINVENSEKIISEIIVEENVNETLIKPINGIITSKFGEQKSQYQYVNGKHTGIDIAADIGTPIISSTNGVVSQVSDKGDYGKHIKISNEKMDVLYAHCNEMYVNEGQEVFQGDIIATVGSTGNSTGPHLHFEIRINNEPIDPSEYIEF